MDRHYTLIGKRCVYTEPGDKTVIIGQTPGCDVVIPNHTQFEDAIIAGISPDRAAAGWHIVRMERAASIKVNGVEINRVHYLQDGDAIEVEGTSFKFREHEGRGEKSSVVVVKRAGAALWGIAAVVAAIAVALGVWIYDSKRENLTDSMRKEIVASLFTTRVDSLQLVCGDSVAESYVYASGAVGTAFLTTDSLIVTARHCLQPWLNMVLPADYGSIPAIPDWPVAKALFAETENQLSGHDLWRVRSFVTFTAENGDSFSLSTDDFKIDTSLDEIVELGGYDDPRYWRSISHRYTRRDMMLGDVAAAKFERGGAIPLATPDEIRNLLNDTGVKLAFFGHPEAGVTGNRLEYKYDQLRLPLSELPELPGRIFLLSHEGQLAPGFSGGPVIVRDGLGFKAVGVVSVTDDRNGYRSYSVPVSEVTKK